MGYDKNWQDNAGHLAWLRDSSTGDNPIITADMARRARLAWQKFRGAAAPAIGEPGSCSAGATHVTRTWCSGTHQIRLHVFADGFELCYGDSSGGYFRAEDWRVFDPLPGFILRRLHFFEA